MSAASHDVTRTAAWLDQADILLQSAAAESNNNNNNNNNYNYSQPTMMSNNNNNSNNNRSISCARIEEQMENVKRLLQDGPIIQQTSSSIPKILEATSTSTSTSTNNVSHNNSLNNNGEQQRHELPSSKKRKVSECAAERIRDSNTNTASSNRGVQQVHVSSSDADAAEKKICKSSTSSSTTTTTNGVLAAAYDTHHNDAEDAEALVGFINAVRRERAYSHG